MKRLAALKLKTAEANDALLIATAKAAQPDPATLIAAQKAYLESKAAFGNLVNTTLASGFKPVIEFPDLGMLGIST